MDSSIYHIENDIDCRVLKFGKEICVAIAGEDFTINLCKGRHKLSFISEENECDSFSMVLEVPENGIEDFIEVELAPIRDSRLEREAREYEAEQERLAALEKRRLEEERAKQEKLAREEQERKLRLEAEMAAEEQRQLERIRFDQNRKIQEKISAAMQIYNDLSNVVGYEYQGLSWIKDCNDLYYLSKNGQRLTDSVFKVVSKFSSGFASVSTNGTDYYFINEYGKKALDFSFQSHSHFYNGAAVVYVIGEPPSCKGTQCVLIDTKGIILKHYPVKRGSGKSAMLEKCMANYKGVMVIYEENDRGGLITAINVFTQEEIYSIQLNLKRVK